MNAKETERQEAIEKLRGMVKPGDTLYAILRHVSRSGMQRTIDVWVMMEDGPFSIAEWAAMVVGEPLDRNRWGVKVRGAGMDMGFGLVYNLSYALFPRGTFVCVGEGCPSNDHSNGDRDYTLHLHSNGGYALRQRWL